jgi:hypothetical protein
MNIDNEDRLLTGSSPEAGEIVKAFGVPPPLLGHVVAINFNLRAEEFALLTVTYEVPVKMIDRMALERIVMKYALKEI